MSDIINKEDCGTTPCSLTMAMNLTPQRNTAALLGCVHTVCRRKSLATSQYSLAI